MLRVFVSARLPSELKGKLEGKAELLDVPLIKTVPLDFNPLIVKAFSPDFIVFSSKNGVKHFFSRVDPRELSGVEVISVGKSTSKELEKLGLRARYPQEFSANGLVEMFKNENLLGKRFLIVRPKVASETFKNFLRERGALTEEIVAYETVPDASKSKEVLEFFKRKVDLAAFTSPSNFRSFLSFISPSLIEDVKLVPIGTTTKEAIEREGYNVYRLPKEFSLKGIVELIEANIGRKPCNR